nr:unnamed protein product [Digitaria exilis]
MAAGGARAPPLLRYAILVLAVVAAHVSLLVRAQDTVAAGRPLSGDAKLVSRGGKFALGFFQPDGGVSGRWYVGIWYNNIAARTPVWVANRERARLRSVSLAARHHARRQPRPSRPLGLPCLSFDHIGDTWLPGGKLRRDKVTGAIQGMTSWRAHGDPSPGMYTLQLDPTGAPQYVLLWNATREYWLTGDWNGRFFTGATEVAASGGDSGYAFRFVDNKRESYFTYNFADNSTVYRFVTDVSGQVKGWFWVEALQQWNLVYAEPKAYKRGTIEIAVAAVAIACSVLGASILFVRTTMARRTMKLVTAEGSVITSFKYRDLQSVTKNFSDKLGGGGFGSVFRGQLPNGGTTAIAVKKLEGLRQGEKQFRAEVSTLGTIQHVNLIRLLGFCSEGGDRKLLVYE